MGVDHGAGDAANSSKLLFPLTTVYGELVLAITCYGGIFSVLPTYVADLWGQKHAGAIHGKLLTALQQFVDLWGRLNFA